VAGVAGAIVNTPADVIRTNIQKDAIKGVSKVRAVPSNERASECAAMVPRPRRMPHTQDSLTSQVIGITPMVRKLREIHAAKGVSGEGLPASEHTLPAA
jgi:hypothetical protein